MYLLDLIQGRNRLLPSVKFQSEETFRAIWPDISPHPPSDSFIVFPTAIEHSMDSPHAFKTVSPLLLLYVAFLQGGESCYVWTSRDGLGPSTLSCNPNASMSKPLSCLATAGVPGTTLHRSHTISRPTCRIYAVARHVQKRHSSAKACTAAKQRCHLLSRSAGSSATGWGHNANVIRPRAERRSRCPILGSQRSPDQKGSYFTTLVFPWCSFLSLELAPLPTLSMRYLSDPPGALVLKGSNILNQGGGHSSWQYWSWSLDL